MQILRLVRSMQKERIESKHAILCLAYRWQMLARQVNDLDVKRMQFRLSIGMFWSNDLANKIFSR